MPPIGRMTGISEVPCEDRAHDSAQKSASGKQHVPIVGHGAMFTRHAMLPIEVVGCATSPPEPVQSDSTNRALAARRGAVR